MSELSERLRCAHQHSTQRIVGSNIFEEAASRIEELEKRDHQVTCIAVARLTRIAEAQARAEKAERALAEAVTHLRAVERIASRCEASAEIEAARAFVKAQEGK